MERRGPGLTGWILAAIVLLMLGGMIATIAVSAHYEVSDGYIPPEERATR